MNYGSRDKPYKSCITCMFFSSCFILRNNLIVFLLMFQAKNNQSDPRHRSMRERLKSDQSEAGTNLISRNFFVYSILAWARSVKNFPSLKNYYFRFSSDFHTSPVLYLDWKVSGPRNRRKG